MLPNICLSLGKVFVRYACLSMSYLKAIKQYDEVCLRHLAIECGLLFVENCAQTVCLYPCQIT